MQITGKNYLLEDPGVTVETENPVAVHSDDHKFPRGTANDDTRYPRFCLAAETVLGSNINFLDLGCSGGGLVFDFLKRGHFAIGLEGSDFSYLNRRANWSLIPKHLFTCDITKEYKIKFSDSNEIVLFDLISAWEVLEHIQERDLEPFFANVRRHLKPGGYFTASVATFEDKDPVSGAIWHVTLQSKSWWHDKLKSLGFSIIEGCFKTADFPRGSGNPFAADWNAEENPELGFHIVVKLG